MAFLKIVLLVAFACLAQCAPFNSADVNDWQQVVKVSVNVSAADGNDNPIVQAFITVTVCGDFNKTTDSHLVSQFVQEKLSSLKYTHEKSALAETSGDGLPLLFSAQFKAREDDSVPVKKSVALLMDIDMYAEKKNHHHALDVVKSFKPSFYM